VDGNVGRLARYLRMAGFDTLYDPAWDERDIVQEIQKDRRILLTRNLDLLKHKEVEFGRCVRAMAPVAQLREILNLFSSTQLPQAFTRCLACNTLLEPVRKEDILDRLEPLTLQYFDIFSICPRCDRIYWPGSHIDRMQQSLNQAKT
jgi:uncharacterized protein with PIN domain